MEHIKDLIPQVVASAQLTKAAPVTTPELARSPFSWEFQTLGDPQLASMLSAAQQFCDGMLSGDEPRWLCLLGNSGAGKTHLARKISRFFKEKLNGALVPGQDFEKTRWRCHGGFLSWRKMADRMRNGDWTTYQTACEDYFVAIDDIGAEYETRFIVSKLDALCDARLGKWTVITANLSLAQISEQMDARIASRMIRNGSVVVDVNVPDWNLRRKAA